MLHMFPHPAFLVKDGTVIAANQPAQELQIKENTSIYDYLLTGQDAYRAFTQGSLSLSIKIEKAVFICAVIHADAYDVFHLMSDTPEQELQALALASQHLREPMSNVFALLDTMHVNKNDLPPTDQLKISQLNKNLLRLLRILGNMSDAGSYAARTRSMETVNISAVISETVEKAANLLYQTGRKLEFISNAEHALGTADRDMLERAVLNLISNAVKFSPDDSCILVRLNANKKRVQLSVENQCNHFTPDMLGTIFFRYSRCPGIDSTGVGLGLGVHLVRAAAAAHAGTLLVTMPKQDCLCFTFTIPIQAARTGTLKSPTLRIDYAGGQDHSLLELSDLLDASLY